MWYNARDEKAGAHILAHDRRTRRRLSRLFSSAAETTTLTGRFVHLVQTGVDRTRILALTFTKKAADDMKARIVTALKLDSASDLNCRNLSWFYLPASPQESAAGRTVQPFPALGGAAATAGL
jgi:hypothetical protein